jgi:hypothetical protein
MDKTKIGIGKLYVVIGVDTYVPHVEKVTTSRDEAMEVAKKYAGDWANATEGGAGEIYFNQEEEGDMEYAVSVSEVEVEGIIVLEKVSPQV